MNQMFRFIFFISFILNIGNQALMSQFSYLNEEHKNLLELRMKDNLEKLGDYTLEIRGNHFLYVPLHIILLKSPDKKSIPVETIFSMVCLLNEQYEPSGIQFFIRDSPQELQSNSIAQNPMSSTSIVELKKVKNPLALNLFIAESDNYTGFFKHIMAYYSPKEDWVVAKSHALYGQNEHLIAHEIGHYFSLLHTFHGWESAPFDYRNSQRAPLLAPDNKTPVEWQSRVHCQTSGDFLCDTPPDYNFGLGWIKNGNTCAPFDAMVQDPGGNLVSTMENNYMSYFLGCADYHFTQDQIGIMQLDYKSNERFYLRSHNYETKSSTLGTCKLIEPSLLRIVGPSNIFFQWEASEGAESYFLKVQNTDNSSVVFEVLTSQTTHSLPFLQEGRYQWTVMPIHPTNTCAPFESPMFFTVGEDLSSLSNKDRNYNFRLSPNILGTHSDNPRLLVKTEISMDIRVSLVNQWGAHLSWIEKNKIVLPGESSLEISVNHLPPGIYFLKIDAYGRNQTLKLFII